MIQISVGPSLCVCVCVGAGGGIILTSSPIDYSLYVGDVDMRLIVDPLAGLDHQRLKIFVLLFTRLSDDTRQNIRHALREENRTQVENMHLHRKQILSYISNLVIPC